MFRKSIEQVFDKIYLQDGVDLSTALERRYPADKISRIAGFLGLPNRLDAENALVGLSWRNVAENFIGYQRNVSRAKKVINIITMPLTVVLNIINIPLRLLTNIAKFFTEFVPAITVKALERAEAELERMKLSHKSSRLTRLLALLGLPLVRLGKWIVGELIYRTGRAITSPINAVKELWHTAKKENARVKGIFFIALSILTSFAFYAALFPLAIKAVSVYTMKLLATHAPGALAKAIHVLANALEPILTKVGKAITPVVKWIVKIFGIGMNLPAGAPAVITSATVAAALTPTLGLAIDEGVNKFQKWWHEPAGAPEPKIMIKPSDDAAFTNNDNIIPAAEENTRMIPAASTGANAVAQPVPSGAPIPIRSSSSLIIKATTTNPKSTEVDPAQQPYYVDGNQFLEQEKNKNKPKAYKLVNTLGSFNEADLYTANDQAPVASSPKEQFLSKEQISPISSFKTQPPTPITKLPKEESSNKPGSP